jgi:hypothetical protein
LGDQIAAVIRRTGLGTVRPGGVPASTDGDDVHRSVPFPVGLIGSAFKAGPMFVEPVSRAVHEIAPEALVSVVESAPVSGSLLLAARACGRDHALEFTELSQLIDSALAEVC